MSTTPSTFAAIRSRFVDEKGMLTYTALKKLIEYEQKLQNTLTLLGQIASATIIQGRTEGIGTTVVKLTAAGLLEDADQIAADGSSFVRVDADQRTGGGRGFVALDANNRLANSLRLNAVNISMSPTSSTVLSNDGAATAIPIAAFSMQHGGGTIAYNSGSVDPGAFGTFYVFADDPTFAGGAVTYSFSATTEDQVANEGRMKVGVITTSSGTPQTGGGSSGGSTPGGGGGGGYNFV